MPGTRAARSDTSMFQAVTGLDKLVLATVNAPFKRAITSDALVASLLGRPRAWRVHANAFFNDVRTDLILAFAEAHGIGLAALKAAYRANAAFSGARNHSLESALAAVETPP